MSRPVDAAEVPGLLVWLTEDLDRPVILLDGGSGAGKSVLATHIAEAYEAAGRPLQLVRLDDVYPGWDGLAAGADAVTDTILRPADPGYRHWNWVENVPTDWVPLNPDRGFLIEGCGAITKRSAPRADVRVWLELDADERKRRALSRDGDGYAPQWDRWAAQELQHWAENRPWELADLIVTTD